MTRRTRMLLAGLVAGVVLLVSAGCTPPAPAPTTVSFGTIDAASSDITWTGGWRNGAADTSSDARGKTADAADASAELEFVGSSIAWMGEKSPEAGLAEVYIDGERVSTVDTYAGENLTGLELYKVAGLSNEPHSIRIVSTGAKNPEAAGARVHVDGFVVGAPAAETFEDSSSWTTYTGDWKELDSKGSSGGGIHYSDDSEAAVSLEFEGPDVTWYTWKSESGGDQKIYIDGDLAATFSSLSSDGSATRVPAFTARDLGAGVHTIRVTSADPGTVHHDSFVVGASTAAPTESIDDLEERLTDAPPTTDRVTTSGQLTAALKAAGPGTVIELAADTTFTGTFKLTASGDADDPIWITGPRSAVLETGDISEGPALRVSGAEHVRLNGFTVTNTRQGVMVNGSDDVAVVGLHVHHTGYEGVHLYDFTTGSYVVGNLIEDTGLDTAGLGEGVYIGTSAERWNVVTEGRPDASSGNVVAGNTINRAGAESIEAKQGTSNGVIRDNVLDGHARNSNARAMILVSGDGWTIESNTMRNARAYLMSVIEGSQAPATGNSFRGNTGEVPSEADAMGFRLVSQPGSDLQVDVACDNVLAGGDAAAFANVFCTP